MPVSFSIGLTTKLDVILRRIDEDDHGSPFIGQMTKALPPSS